MTALTLDAREPVLPGLTQDAGGSGINRVDLGAIPAGNPAPWVNTAPPLLWAERVKKKPTRAAIELQEVRIFRGVSFEGITRDSKSNMLL